MFGLSVATVEIMIKLYWWGIGSNWVGKCGRFQRRRSEVWIQWWTNFIQLIEEALRREENRYNEWPSYKF